DAIIARYLKENRGAIRMAQTEPRFIQANLRLERVSTSATRLCSGEPFKVEWSFHADEPGQLRECAVLFYSAKGVRLAIVDLRDAGIVPLRYKRGRFALRIQINSLPLVEGDVVLGLYLVTDYFAGDLLELAELTVFEGSSAEGFVRYPANARG